MADYPCPPWARPRGPATAPAHQGFTLIELLVVIVMVGILAAIAVPSFLSQAARAKQAQALHFIGMVNRAQQAFYMENARFAVSTVELGVTDSLASHYTYTITSSNAGPAITSTQAIPVDPALRGYAGVVFTTVDPNGTARTATVICQGTVATTPTPTPVRVAGKVQIADCNGL